GTPCTGAGLLPILSCGLPLSSSQYRQAACGFPSSPVPCTLRGIVFDRGGTVMAFRLGMLGMWHTHAHGLVRQAAMYPKEFTLAGFFDADPKVAADRKQKWEKLVPKLRLFDSPEALLRQPLDGVVVEGRVFENLKLARLALESGRPVLLEKPAGNDLAEHRRLVELARRKHLHLQTLYLFRYMSAVQEMLKRVRKGELGQVYEFRARLPKDLGDYQRFVEELKPYPGGMFFEMAGHVIDMM